MLPVSFQNLIHKAVEKNPNDPNSAIEEVIGSAHSLPEYGQTLAQLVRIAISNEVYKHRHTLTVEAKRASREYGSGNRVNPTGLGVSRVYKSFYDSFHIGGKVLGDLTGIDVKHILRRQRAMVKGHLVNIKFLEWLEQQEIPQDKKLREVVAVETAMEQYSLIEREVKE
jgi:hypothetical protein